VETVTFRATTRQMRDLVLFTAASGAIAAVLLSVVFAGGIDPGGRLLALGLACGCCSFDALIVIVLYRRAFTTCSADLLSSRGLIGPRHSCPWDQVTDIRIRESAAGRGGLTRTVTVSTTAGTEFALGAPVAGGLMPDPDFDAKVRQIRSLWQAATAGRPGRQVSGRIPVYVAAGPKLPVRTVLRGGVVVILAATIVMLPFAISSGGEALSIRLGSGQPGTFSPVSQTCGGSCYWVGAFRASAGSPVFSGLALVPGGNVTKAGERMPAVYPGHGGLVYPTNGGVGWIPLVLVIVTIAGCLAAIAYWTFRRQWRAHGDAPGRALGPYGIGLALGGVIILIVFGGAFVSVTAQDVPPARTLPTVVACAEYSAWLQAQASNGGPPSRDPALLAQAQRHAPPGQLGSDLNTLAADVSIAIAAGGTQAGLVDDLNATNAMSVVTRDCFR
jgi:hypothetical protein